MRITSATPGAAPSIEAVARTAWHATYDHIIGEKAVDELVDNWYDVEDIRRSIERDIAPMFIAIEQESTLGFAQGGPTEAGPADAVISRIYVHPDRWGERIGSRLLDRLCGTLADRGYEAIWLAVLAENEVGRRFYEAKGFEKVERQFTELAGVEHEELLLTKHLE